jgi:hypothetical protein
VRSRGDTAGFVRRHRTTIASWSALTVLAGALAAFAITSDGYPVHKAELNDGGVWVTNQAMGAVGRENVPVAQIDARVFDGPTEAKRAGLDVIQDGSAVFTLDRDAGTLMPVDVSLGTGLEDQRVRGGGSAAYYGGRTLGVLDPATGKLWATRVDPDTGAASLDPVGQEARPLATVGARAVGTVSRAGTLYAVSAAGTLLTVRPGPGATGFAKPASEKLGGDHAAYTGMTAVGDQPAMLDDAGNLLTDGTGLGNVGRDAVLQQPGPAADEVVVATKEALVAKALGGDASRVLAQVGRQDSAAAPVVMPNGCTFAAWAAGSVGMLATACGGGDAETHPFDVHPGAQLVFRVNRNQVVLNDERTGDVWSVADAEPQRISTWEAFRKQPQKNDDREARKADAQVDQKPRAEDDELGARPGRTTVLNVLDNDRIASDGVLSVVGVGGAQRQGVEVRIAPDRQTLLATVPAEARGTLTFTYTIDDGTSTSKNAQDEGEVTLHLREDPGSGRPQLRPHAPERTFPVTAGGVVEFAVTPDWRDPTYGDPVAVDSVKAGGDLEVSTTALGLVRVEAPAGSKGGPRTVDYEVTTGGDTTVAGSARVEVVAAGTRTVAAQAEADVVSGEAGAPITVHPLDNDIPGADGSDPGAELALAGRVAPTGGLKVDTDLESGRVTVTGASAGTYFLEYAAAYGAAQRANGRIRLDITAPTALSDTPVATPDNANVHGMSPTIVDVLANDYDPKGRMLVVQNARPAKGSGQLEVAVIEGRWIRVDATDPAIMPASQSVTYTVSNGVNTADGSISVTQRRAVTGVANAPVTQVDRVTVRAGDTASVPVLDNDSTPSGDPVGLALVPELAHVGELRVLPAAGTAYVAGRRVRFVAPEDVAGATDVEVEYVATNTGDPTAPTTVGKLRVHITPKPSPTNPDQAPTPRALEGRVVQGDVVTLKLPAIGSDPDGDSVAIDGIETPPAFGRILKYGANSLTYQAFPDATGTDEFRYTVTDRFGFTGSAVARIGVVAAGEPQAPLAVDDEVRAAPGRTVDVDVLANDMRPRGTKVTILPLEGAPAGVQLRSDAGPLEVVAPQDGRTTRVVYTVTNGLDESRAVVTVTGQAGFNNPPVVGDIYATPKAGAGSVSVDVLGSAVDIDGPESDLQLVDVTGDGLAGGETGQVADATKGDGSGDSADPASGDGSTAKARIEGGRVVVPITGVAQVLAYRVQDGDGAAAAAAIYVPARPTGAPYLRPGAHLELDPGSSVTAQLADLVVDPEGDPVRLTVTDTISSSPSSLGLSVLASDEKTLKIKASKHKGPGAVTFEVSDRPDLDDPKAHRAFIAVPTQVGDPEPVINCPADAILVPEGGVSRTVDIAAVCHVWTADPGDADDLEFTARWKQPINGVDVATADDGDLRLEASGDARRGAVGSLSIAARGHQATGTLNVEVVSLPAPRLAPIRLDTKVGEPVTVDVAQYLSSPMPASSREVSIVDVSPVGGASAGHTIKGSKLTFSPKPGTHGVLRYRIEVSDVGGSRSGGRPTAVGELQLAVVDRPDAPTDVRIGTELLSKTVALTWTTPENNGERIDHYQVSYAGQQADCPGSPCRVTGLQNGKDYTFTVKAHNAVGWSDDSRGVTGRADAFTGPVRNPRIVLARDNRLQVAWSAPASCDCSSVKYYQVSAPGLVKRVSATTLSYQVPAANGESTTVTITPLNDKGLKENAGPRTTVTGIAAGKPAPPGQPSVAAADVAGGSQKTFTVTWSPVGANGPDPVAYEVSRDGTVVCGWTTATRCVDAGIRSDGHVYTYKVRAKNAEADSSREAAVGGAANHISAESAGKAVEAAAPPAAPVIRSITPTGSNGQAKIVFDAGPSHGGANKISCSPGSCAWSGPTSGGSSKSVLVSGLPNSPTSVRLVACNGSQNPDLACTTGAAAHVEPYGPIGTVSIVATPIGQDVKWTIDVDPNGKRVHWQVRRHSPGNDYTTVIKSGDSGTGRFTASSQATMSWDRTYQYYLDVTDIDAPLRGDRHDSAEATTSTTTGPAVYSSKADAGCTANCNVQAFGENFRAKSACSVYRGGPDAVPLGARVGSWTQPAGDVSYRTPVKLDLNEQYHIRCANGAVSRSYTWFN